MSYRPLATAALAFLGLAGCATPPAQPQPTTDYNVGIASTCSFTPNPVTAVPGGSASAAITMSNDGWCAARLVERDGQPFLLGLMRTRPEHGRVVIEKIGGQTRLEYTAETAFVGTDRFSAALRSRNGSTPDSVVEVAVTVNQGPNVAPPPAATPEPTRPTRRAPARRTPTRRPAHSSSSSSSTAH